MYQYDYRFHKWENAVQASRYWAYRGSEARCRVFSDPAGEHEPAWVLRVTNPRPVGDGWVAA